MKSIFLLCLSLFIVCSLQAQVFAEPDVTGLGMKDGEIFILIITLIIFLAIRPITVFFHEMGHALPAALFTKSKKIEVYVGSFGDMSNSWQFKAGKFWFFFKYNPLDWTHGLCRYDEFPKYYGLRYVITLGGPFASFLIGVACIIPAFYFDMNGYLQFLSITFMSSAVHDLWWNIKPSYEPILLHDGTITYNDGYSLLRTWRNRKESPLVWKGHGLFNEGKYEEAVECYEQVIAQGKANDEVLYWTMIAHYQRKDYKAVTNVEQMISDKNRLSEKDYLPLAYAYNVTGNSDKAIEFCSLLIDANKADVNGLNSRAHYRTLVGEYDKAIEDCKRAIELDENFADAYNIMGFAKMHLGKVKEAIADIEHSLLLDRDNAYAYRNLGMCYMRMDDMQRAHAELKKAYEIDRDIPLLEDLFAEVNEKLTV